MTISNPTEQWRYHEVCVKDITIYSTECIPTDTESSEEFVELKAKLKAQLYALADKTLTKRQLQIINLVKDGYTQEEIARKLGVIQNTISKMIHGNIVYKPTGKVRTGGIAAALKYATDNDPEIQKTLSELKKLKEGDI
jgi:FixJ family two-component response regulator